MHGVVGENFLEFTEDTIAKICEFIEGIQKEIGKPKFDYEHMEVPEDVYEAVKEIAIDKVRAALDTDDKNVRDARMEPVRDKIMEAFLEKYPELETIYEEKNMSLTQDSRKVSEAMLRSLFPNHPYGQQTILGSQEHLKNPSITNVKAYHANWYVPNNMAVCVSGDFDPEVMIETIDRYFGDMVPNPNLKYLDVPELEPLKEVVRTDIYGLDAENVLLAWRLGGYTSEDALIGDIASGIINNGYAGLIDLNINQQQKALSASGGTEFLADYGIFELAGRPKTGQTL